MNQPWLGAFSWEVVTSLNAMLCQASGALHKPTSDGHEPAKALWDSRHAEERSLSAAVDLCRQCHRLAPFCNFNGNTFAAVARDLVPPLKLPADRAYLVRSWIGHIVAGTASEVEVEQFQAFCRSLKA